MNFFIEQHSNDVDLVTAWLIDNVGPVVDRKLGHWIGKEWSIQWFGPIGGVNTNSYKVIIDNEKLATMAILKWGQSNG